jgi:hypothetical protein
MFKKIILITVLAVVTGILIFGTANLALANSGIEDLSQGFGGNGRNGMPRGGNGRPTNTAGTGLYANALPAASGDLSEAEASALVFMREEEKLAHDVYLTLYEKWGLPVFQNISQSELAHTEAVLTLIERYGLQDPAQAGIGAFTNPDLQALYNELVARGSQSLSEALKVGAAIEEIDILDLQERLAATDQADIQQVFTNLLNGSTNHLRAFVSSLKTQTGETYLPQYLSEDAYQAILDSSAGAGVNGASLGGFSNGQGGGGYRGGRP